MEAVKHRTALNLVNRLTTATTAAVLSTALSEIRLLTKSDPDIRLPLADSGLVPVLTHFLLLEQQQGEDEDDDFVMQQENAIATLLNLSITSPESLMSAPSILPSLSLALRRGGPNVLAQHAAATLYSLLSVEAYRPIIGSKHDQIVAPLISLVASPTSRSRTVKDALKALFAIALYPLNRPALVDLGIFPSVFALMVKDRRSGMVEDASAVIAQVAGCYESVEGLRKVGGVRMLVELADGGSERARENAASALLNLALSGGDRAVGDIMEMEMVEEAMRELAETGSARAKSKAGGLLRVLSARRRGSWNHDPYSDNGSSSDINSASLAGFSSSVDSSSSF